MPRSFRFASFALVLVLALVLPAFLGCSSDNFGYGRLNPSRAVTQMFQDSQIQNGYKYYMVETEGRPAAILGIAPGYELEGKAWRPVDLSSGQVEKQVQGLTVDPDYETQIQGAKIEDAKGNQVGVWFSNLPRTSASVRGQKVKVEAP